MILREHPENETILNKRVWDYHKTKKGTVVLFDGRDVIPSIDIKWDNGEFSERCFMRFLEIEIAE